MMIMITTIIMVMMVLSKLKLIGLAAKPAGNCICIRICICLCICISVCICILVLYNVQTMSLLLAAWRPSTVVPPSWAHPSLIYFFILKTITHTSWDVRTLRPAASLQHLAEPPLIVILSRRRNDNSHLFSRRFSSKNIQVCSIFQGSI